MNRFRTKFVLVTFGMCGMLAALVGCERKERVLHVETPRGEIDVERDIDDGDVDITVEDNRPIR